MRVLFIHPTFPGPFRPLAACLGAMAGAKVLFLAERHQRTARIPGVRRLFMAPPAPVEAINSAERESLLTLRRGAQAANAMLKLQREGFQPDILCTVSSSGSGFYAADVFPRAFQVCYADWFHTRADCNAFLGFSAHAPEEFAPLRVRNLCQLNALHAAHLIITHSAWQKAQFPQQLAPEILVLPHGVDTGLFRPAARNASATAENLTFTAHSLEPHRGFFHIMQAIPDILNARPHCNVLLMATTRVVGDALSALNISASFPQISAEQQERVHILGYKPQEEYLHILQSSAVHVYLTVPYALSSGLLEAMSCGCLVLGSDTEPVREVLHHGENGFLCGFHHPQALPDAVIDLLERIERQDTAIARVRRAARQSILEHYDSRALGPLCLKTLLDAYDGRESFEPGS